MEEQKEGRREGRDKEGRELMEKLSKEEDKNRGKEGR